MTDDEFRMAESYVLSAVSHNLSGRRIDAVIAAGMVKGFGTSMLRLKYAQDPAAYYCSRDNLINKALTASHLLGLGCDELIEVLSVFVLDSWLLDRRLFVKQEWLEYVDLLRSILVNEERKTVAEMMRVCL